MYILNHLEIGDLTWVLMFNELIKQAEEKHFIAFSQQF